VRLFVALDFPENVRSALRDLIAQFKPLCRAPRWVRPEGMHITLKFIGEVRPDKVEPIKAALFPIGSPEPVVMHFRGLGFFPNDRGPRVVWCGVEASGNLAVLAAHIEDALKPLGIAPETRAFVPHLTLARFPSHEGVDEVVRAANERKSYDFGSAREMDFHLFESILGRSGAEYKRLATYAFVKRPE
jgi:RNA 2',3'-cyclic 3'-phosphodiesterase